MRSVFALALGLGAGLLVGGYVVRRIDQATRAAHPVQLADRAGRAAGSFSARLQEAAAAGRVAAADREAQLRREWDVQPVRELADQQR
jgi:hypothetical protein